MMISSQSPRDQRRVWQSLTGHLTFIVRQDVDYYGSCSMVTIEEFTNEENTTVEVEPGCTEIVRERVLHERQLRRNAEIFTGRTTCLLVSQT